MAGSDHSRKPTAPFTFDRSFSVTESTKKSNFYQFASMKKPTIEPGFIEGKVKKLCNSFESALAKKILSNSKPTQKQLSNGDTDLSSRRSILGRSMSSSTSSSRTGMLLDNRIRLPGTEDRIVVYSTSLRGIRRTYDDCYAVRMILRGFRVPVDERDVSMDSAYRIELLTVLGEKTVSLPRVFIRGKYVGGVDEVKQLYEGGDLLKLLKGFPLRDTRLVCESCGDARFVPCLNCSGSRKIYSEEEDTMRRCVDCNENGLMRCSNCCQ